MKRQFSFSTLFALCGAILLALSLNQPAHAQGTEITNAANGILNQFIIGPGKMLSDTPQVTDAVKQQVVANLASQGIVLNPAVVAYFPSGSYVSDRGTVLLAVVAGQKRPDVRKVTAIIRRQGSTYPNAIVVQKSFSGGLSQFSPEGLWSGDGSVLSSGNYDVDIISATEDGQYLESVHTRFYFGFITGGNDRDGMRVDEFKTQWTGSGWYATLKGHDLGLRTLVMVTYRALTVPFEVNPVIDQDGNAEAGFFLPFTIVPPSLDITELCNLTVQNLNGPRFESVTRREFVRLRSYYER